MALDRILILEQDPTNPAVWAYGLADNDGHLPTEPYRLRYSPTGTQPPTSGDWREESLWVTAILLVRQAGDRIRIVYNLSPARDTPEPPPPPPAAKWERSTAKRALGSPPGETLGQRAERTRQDGPRAARP